MTTMKRRLEVLLGIVANASTRVLTALSINKDSLNDVV